MFKFFKEFVIYGMTSMLSKFIAIFLMPIYTNILTQEEYGAMALITSCVGIIGLFSNLEIHTGITRDYYEEDVDRKKLVSTGFFSILSVSLMILLFMLLSFNFWVERVLDITEYKLAFLIMLITIPTGSLLSYFAILMRFKNKPFWYSLISISQLLLQVSISIIGVIRNYGIVSIYFGMLIGEIFAIIFFVYFSRKELSFTFSFLYLKRALLYGLPILPAVLAHWVDGSLGQIFIGKYISKSDLAIYSVALSFASIFSMVALSLKNAWLPFLYENYKKPNFHALVIKLFEGIVIVLLIIIVSLSLLSKEFIVLLSNISYVDASQYLPLLSLAMSIFILFPIVGSGIYIIRKTKYIGIAYIVGSLFNMSSMILFLPKFGVVVVPISLALSRIVCYIILYFVTRQQKILELPNFYVILLIISSILSYFVVYCDLILWWRVFILILFDGIMLFVLIKKYKGVFYFLLKKK